MNGKPVAYAMNAGVRIHYQIAGSGPPLLLHHGFGGSSADWLDFGLVQPLKNHYRLIMPDARGHGRSDTPHDPRDYTSERKVADMLAVLDDLGIERAHYFGYSYGGLMGWMLGTRAPGRFLSMAIGGAQPYMPEGPEMMGRFDAMLRYLGQGTDSYVRWREEHGTQWPVDFRARMLANDPQALMTYLQATPAHYPLEPLTRMTMPVLVISGDDDELMAGSQARRAAASLPNGRFLEIPDADHPALYLDSARIAPALVEFLADVAGPLVPVAG